MTGAGRVRTERVTIEGVEFTVTLTPGDGIGLLALHASVEGGTGELADELTGRCGATSLVYRQCDGDPVHIPSPRMGAAPCALLRDFLTRVDAVVSLHGHLRTAAPRAIFLGGADRDAARLFAGALETLRPRFEPVADLARIPVALRGVHPRNPVNLAGGRGVQVELPLLARTTTPGGADVPPREVADALADGVGRLRGFGPRP
ncbi:poly-gamma-glutamate hydrolase family protein [Streptomyces sp. NPDC006975]|uniref:poly-gamma-glutamate hydrolase family protein n=1 Tax=Streptomyces sp. NPDC006975 TaxID=3154310 RepID=UPI0034563171